ncbi:hypothetical protein ABPG72_021743 [Tetrahymena utriculariae]
MTKILDLNQMLENFYHDNIQKGKSFVAHHFMSSGLSQSTAYRKIKQLEKGSLKRKSGSGRIPTVATKKNIKKITKYFKNKDGVSQRNAAKQFKCSQGYISKIISKKTNLKCFKKMKRPFRSTQQIKDIRPKCRKLYDLYKNQDFIMDDESYFTLSHSTLAGNDIYYAPKRCESEDGVRFKTVKKYEQKLLVSICICPKNISKIYIHQSKQAINAETYIKILRQTLIPLLNENYKNNQGCIFWPDKAQAHYAKSVLEFLKKRKVKFVTYSQNPSNLPEARPIENFWGDLKRLVYANNWKAKDLIELEARIKQCVSKMNTNQYLKQIQNLPSKLNKIAKYGL